MNLYTSLQINIQAYFPKTLCLGGMQSYTCYTFLCWFYYFVLLGVECDYWFHRFPYFLPCLSISFLASVSSVTSYWLPVCCMIKYLSSLLLKTNLIYLHSQWPLSFTACQFSKPVLNFNTVSQSEYILPIYFCLKNYVGQFNSVVMWTSGGFEMNINCFLL